MNETWWTRFREGWESYGVKFQNEDGTYRSCYEVLNEMASVWKSIEEKNENEAIWLDDGDCLICSSCHKTITEPYFNRDGDWVRAPYYCPSCDSFMAEIKKA